MASRPVHTSARLLVGGLLVLIASCSGGVQDAGGGTTGPVSSSAAPTGAADPGTPPTAGAVVLEEPFDDDRNGWGTLEDAGASAGYADGDYVLRTPAPGAFGAVPAPAPTLPASLVADLDVRVPTGGATVALTCDARETAAGGGELRFYALAVGEREALITRATSTTLLPQGRVLARAPSSVDLTQPHRLEAACVTRGTGRALFLLVDGTLLLSALDPDPLPAGTVGFVVETSTTTPTGTPVEVRLSALQVAEAG